MKTGKQSILLVSFLLLTSRAPAEPQWSVTNLSLLNGSGFKLADDSQSTFTLDHASGWKFGDIFLFVDLFEPQEEHRIAYGEFHLRLSYAKLSGNALNMGPLKDLSFATQTEHGENFESWLYGVGFDFDVLGFNYFNTNIYVRNNSAQDGVTWQISPYWQAPFSLGKSQWYFEGFADIAGREDGASHNVIFQPQILWDAGAQLGRPGRIKLGMEYGYWKNKYGISGVTESVPQVILKLTP